MIVIDALVAAKWFVEEDGHASALGLLDQDLAISAPDLIFAETANVLWKKLRRGQVTSEQVEKACGTLPTFFQGVVTSASLLPDALRFARSLDHPVYGCIYLACAQFQSTKLVTADQRFVSIVKNRRLSHLVAALSEAAELAKDMSHGGLSRLPQDQSNPDSNQET